MAEQITVRVNRYVKGPNGDKLHPGDFVPLSDSPYTRALIKGGSVELVDPPSLDYLDKPKAAEKPKVEEKPKPKTKDLFKTIEPKIKEVSEPKSEDEGEPEVAPE